jgi:hypothetical protein
MVDSEGDLPQEVVMMQHTQHPTSSADQRRREETWHAATAEVIAEATGRYDSLGRLLGLGPHARSAFVSAALEAARQYQTGFLYANYERRTGHPYPDEGRDNEDVVRAAAWEMEVARMQAALNAERR